MSIKDRISFWEQKKVVDEVKPFPKPVVFQQKKPVVNAAPVQIKISPQLPIVNKVTEKIAPQQPKKQFKDIVSQQSAQKETAKKIQQTLLTKQEAKVVKKDDTETKQQDKIISVKANINKFNNLVLPMQGPSFQSCIVGPSKKNVNRPVENAEQKQTTPQLMKSMPLYEVQTQEQRPLTFKQKLLLAEKSLANRNGVFALPKKLPEEAEKDHQDVENSETNNINESKQQTNDGKHDIPKQQPSDESDKLFLESMREDSQRQYNLLGGQMNNLTIDTRMTKRPKKKAQEDDFDDL